MVTLRFYAVILGFVALMATAVCVVTARSQEAPDMATYKRVTPETGEQCIICDVELSDEDPVLIVRGRRVPLKNAMVDSFMNNQDEYFVRLQPKSALFQEELHAPAGVVLFGVRFGWFLFGAHVLVALIFSGLSGYAAVSKGLSPVPHFFIGFFFSAFGYLYVLTRPSAVQDEEIPAGLVKVPSTSAPTPCPACGSTNHPSARQCAGCGATLEPRVQSEVERA